MKVQVVYNGDESAFFDKLQAIWLSVGKDAVRLAVEDNIGVRYHIIIEKVTNLILWSDMDMPDDIKEFSNALPTKANEQEGNPGEARGALG